MKTCLIIGDPVAHSLSPPIHNAAYKELGIDDQYHYIARQIKPAELATFMDTVRTSDIRGLSCTAPHKVAIMDYMDEIDEVARKIGAVNTVVNDNGQLKGYNTDWLGAVLPLEKFAPLKDQKVALLGAGGAARAIAYGMTTKGAQLTIYNRTLDKAHELAAEFGAQGAALADPASIKDMDVIINATSVSMHPQDDKTPLPPEFITSNQIVFDSIYTPYDTQLLREAQQQGAQVVHGTEMLLQQAVAQFKLYTGYDAPEETMRTALQKALKVSREA
jgi:shikimate dehydrogenase